MGDPINIPTTPLFGATKCPLSLSNTEAHEGGIRWSRGGDQVVTWGDQVVTWGDQVVTWGGGGGSGGHVSRDMKCSKMVTENKNVYVFHQMNDLLYWKSSDTKMFNVFLTDFCVVICDKMTGIIHITCHLK